MMEILNVDSDGVLYNLTDHLSYMDGYSYQQYWIDKANERGMKLSDYYSERMNDHIPNGLFLHGRPMVDAERLLDHVYDIKMKTGVKLVCLTAGPHGHPQFDIVERDKKQWFKDIGFDKYFDEIIVTDGSHGKLEHSSEKSILIDDHTGSQRRFKEKNFPFILHRNTKQTIEELKKYF